MTFYHDVKSSGVIDHSSDNVVIPTVLAASVKATDGKGNMIENNGVAESQEITLSEYFNGRYSTDLRFN